MIGAMIRYATEAVALLSFALPAWAQQNATAPSALMTLLDWCPFVLEGFLLNLLMSAIAIVLATVFGFLLALACLSNANLLNWPARFVVHLLRNSPWIVVLFAILFLLPFQIELPGNVDITIPDWCKATVGFALPVMANLSEVLRGAILSIPSGQWESAESLALSRWQTYRHVILPQCIRRTLPSWMNWYALLTLSTPIASVVGVQDVVTNTRAAMEAAGGRPELLLPFYAFVLLLFFAYIYPISLWTRRLERRFSRQ